MSGDEQTRSPVPRRRRQDATPIGARGKGVADVTISDGRVTIKTGTLIAIVGALLGTGGGTGLMTLLDRPNPELVQRVETLEVQLAEHHRAQQESTKLISQISRIVEQAHPVTRHGVPGTVSPLGTVTPQ